MLSEGSGRSGDWQENFQLYAEALGQREAAAELLRNYDGEAEKLSKQLGNPSRTVVSVVIIGGGRIGVYTVKSFSGSIL